MLTNGGNNDRTRVDYSTTLQTRNWSNNPVSAPFRWNTNGGVTQGQFGGSGHDPVSPTSNGMQGADGRVAVRDGDPLQSFAASQWGDASLWYMLAEANGLSGSEAPPDKASISDERPAAAFGKAKVFHKRKALSPFFELAEPRPIP